MLTLADSNASPRIQVSGTVVSTNTTIDKLTAVLKKYGLEESSRNEGLDDLALIHYSNGKPVGKGTLGLSIYVYSDGGWDYDKGIQAFQLS